MKVAEIIVTSASFMSHGMATHCVGFADVAAAKAEYNRIADLVTARDEKKNDLPKMVVLAGDCGQTCTMPLSTIHSVSWIDFATANEREAGVKDAFPNLFKR